MLVSSIKILKPTSIAVDLTKEVTDLSKDSVSKQ